MDHEIQFMTSIKLLHVLALEFFPQGVQKNKEIQVQHTNTGTDCPHWCH